MAGNIKVTPEQLEALSAQVMRSAGEIDQQLGGLANTLAPLGSEWAGHAQQQFQQLWAEWHTSAVRLREALDGIGRLMNQAGHAYASAEQQIAATFRA
jgi:WXG100 family type VII secretion target